ncbi:DUF4178 domain-containing protein [Rubricoccus marinus]|uniref:DUF4178 domain-containing protein n=1 Tax=Rubricoccus marinus TaxID=716817 RepID=A0A259U1P6_9BACT|nr:DUF4178 domain-containing protein [Rubricoccus marinus]OZC03919.1 hypothetical protein BSZ36_13575 [Rubricoccus marinus]
MDDQHHCPTCGAPLRIKNRFVKAVTCEFCQNVALYDGVRLDPTGRTASLAQLKSPLYLDATGRVGTHAFRVLGRLVYEYEGGTWQEWFLDIGGEKRAWLIEDEGAFSLLQKRPLAQAPPFAGIQVGDVLTLADREVRVDEVGEATIVSAEGQFGTLILPGEAIAYVDGASGDEEVGLEYGEREVELFVGRPVDRADVTVDPDPFS